MNNHSSIKVIVPESKGVEVLKDVAGLETILVEPGQPIPENAKKAEILVVGPAEKQAEVDAALEQIRQLPHLKLIQTLGQGTEQWDGVLPTGVELSTARGAHGGSTAELIMALLLAQIRQLPLYMTQQQSHTWRGQRSQTLMNMKVLIFGTGDLGSNVQKRLEPFGADITMVGSQARDGVIDVATARDMLPKTDAVVIALPLTPGTKHIVDSGFLAALPDSAIIINAGRGGLIDQSALLEEIQSGRLLAALDVMTPEPLPADNPLWDAPGVLLTPHVGGNTDGADERAWRIAAERIRDYQEKL